jgi:hypothetical protein
MKPHEAVDRLRQLGTEAVASSRVVYDPDLIVRAGVS